MASEEMGGPPSLESCSYELYFWLGNLDTTLIEMLDCARMLFFETFHYSNGQKVSHLMCSHYEWQISISIF